MLSVSSSSRESSVISSSSNNVNMAIFFNLILSMMITLRQFETKRRQKRPRQEREVKKRRIDLCLQSTPFVRYLFSLSMHFSGWKVI